MSGNSILTYASEWNKEEGNRYNSTQRKKIPVLSQLARNNKTVKKNININNEGPDEFPADEREAFQSLSPASIDSVSQDNDLRTSKVHDIINNIKSVNPENDGNYLANFDYANKPKPPIIKPTASSYSTNETPLGNYYGSYNDVYNPSSKIGEVSYYNSQKPTNASFPTNDKFMEKMNYMIHLLEEQQIEPTKHITEEFILYTFLGIFVIYIVDSFARSGKYIR